MRQKGWLKQAGLLLTILPLLLYSCTPSDEKKIESLRLEVIAIHDEAMALMGPMYELEMELTGQSDERKQQGRSTDAQQVAISALIQAQEAMMEWMRKYSPPDDNSSFQEAMTYFQDQKAQIKKVRRMTDKAIKEAETLLDTNQ